MLLGLTILLGIQGSLSSDQTNHGPQVGKLLMGANKTSLGCLATLIGEKTILTTADCLKITKSGTIYFILGRRQSQVVKVFSSPARTGNEHNYAVGTLDNTFKKSKSDNSQFSWTYKSVEDIGITVQFESKNFSCRSSQSKSELRVRQMKTEVIRMSCSGMPQEVPKGAPVFIKDNSDLNIIGVYQGRCTEGKASKNTVVCATRIHLNAFNTVCDLAMKNKFSVPGCQNSWLKQGNVLLLIVSFLTYLKPSEIYIYYCSMVISPVDHKSH